MIASNRPAGWQPAGMPGRCGALGHGREEYRLAGEAMQADEPSPLAAEARPEADHTPTVLLVEDDEPTRLAMASWLAHEGFLVLTAADGHEAASHLERPLEPIDVAVLDIGLPDVDGITLCERLRQMYPKMPVVVCTGHADPAEVARLVELGASRYFRKPIEPDELLAAVESALP